MFPISLFLTNPLCFDVLNAYDRGEASYHTVLSCWRLGSRILNISIRSWTVEQFYKAFARGDTK